MKRRNFTLCLLAALILPATVLVYLSTKQMTAETAKPTLVGSDLSSHTRRNDPRAESFGARKETIQTFLQLISSWEKASGPEGDRLEEQLRNLITDDNAEDLLRAAPAQFHGTYVANLMLARWAARDRSAAIEWLAAQPKPTLFEVNSVTKNWVVQDSKSLGEYLERLPGSRWKNLVLESTGRDALTNRDPEQAFSLLRAMDESPARTPLLANAVQQWAEWDPHAAVEGINKLSNPATRERLVLAAASGYARVNPSAAANWLLQSFPEGPTLDRGLAGVMQSWTSTGDPSSGAQWVTGLPAGHTRDQALKELIAGWNRENAGGLENWMSALPEGSVRAEADAVLKSLVSSL